MSISDIVTVVIATLVLMVAGGLIAYLGDRWGYAWGKKRLSLFGMRPKKTASFLTMVAGALIALITLGVLLTINAGFRVALIQGKALLHTNHVLKYQNRDYKVQNQALGTRNQVLNQQASLYQAEDQQDREREREARASLTKTKAQLGAIQAKLNASNERLQIADASVAKAQALVASAQTRVASLRRQEATLTRYVGFLDANIKLRTRNPIIYTDGAEVGRSVIASDDGETSIRRELIYFLEDLSAKAEQQGAVPGQSNRAVEVASIRIGSSPTFAEENDSLNALAQQIHGHGGGSVVVIAYAAGNSFVHKPVYVRLKPYANPLVIPAGTILGETTIPGQQKGVAEILTDMKSFLLGPVHQKALARGVIPVKPQDYIGDWGADKIDPTVSQIQSVKGDAVVVALAAKDIYAADPVSLDFTVRPAPIQPVATQISNP